MDNGLGAAMARYAQNGHGPAKALLVCISLCCGLGFITYLSFSSVPELITRNGVQQVVRQYSVFDWSTFAEYLPIGVALAFVYTILGAAMIAVCEYVKRWAYLDNIPPWNTDRKLVLASFFPLTLICSLIIYSFLGVIHRAFPFASES